MTTPVNAVPNPAAQLHPVVEADKENAGQPAAAPMQQPPRPLNKDPHLEHLQELGKQPGAAATASADGSGAGKIPGFTAAKSPETGAPAPTEADRKNAERLALLKEIDSLCGELWDMELNLITEAGKVFNEEAFKTATDPRKFAIDDPKRWAATIEVSQKIKQVKASMAAKDADAAETKDLRALDKKIATKDKLYWQNFEKTRVADPHWYHAASAYLAATDVIEALVIKAPANSDAILKVLAEERKEEQAEQGKPESAGTYDYQLHQVAPRMTGALVKLLRSHGASDADKACGQADVEAAVAKRIETVQALGKTWAALNMQASQPDKQPEDWQTQYAKVRAGLAELTIDLQKKPKEPPVAPAAPDPAPQPQAQPQPEKSPA